MKCNCWRPPPPPLPLLLLLPLLGGSTSAVVEEVVVDPVPPVQHCINLYDFEVGARKATRVLTCLVISEARSESALPWS